MEGSREQEVEFVETFSVIVALKNSLELIKSFLGGPSSNTLVSLVLLYYKVSNCHGI